MIKIIPLTRERIKKFSIFGADVSIGFADYAEVTHVVNTKPTPVNIIKRVVYLFDNTEENEIITTRLVLWRFKLEVKTVVQYKTQPEGFRIATDFKFA